MADARKFIYDSDYPMPYLAYSSTCNYTVGGNEWYKTVSFAHNLPFTPLLIGQWSTDPSFSVSYDIAMSIPSFSGSQPLFAAVVEADASSVWLDLTNNTGSDLTFYFRFTAFPPSDYTSEITAIDDASNFKFDSDFNYFKIAEQGKVTVSAGGYAAVNHGLGYVPQSRIWYGFNTYIGGANRYVVAPLNMTRTTSGALGASVDSTSLWLQNSANAMAATTDFYYQIYADEV